MVGDLDRHPGWPVSAGPVRVRAGEVSIRPVRLRDGRAWSRIRIRDRDYLHPWEADVPGPWQERHTWSAWLTQWSGLRAIARRGQALPFAVTVDGEFAGQLTIGNIVRGALGSGWVGYWVSSEIAGGGATTAAVALAVDHAFTRAGMHRIEATVQPENAASRRVLTKLGFRQEGLLQRYLHVAGRWRDHELWALTREETGSGLVNRLIKDGGASRPG